MKTINIIDIAEKVNFPFPGEPVAMVRQAVKTICKKLVRKVNYDINELIEDKWEDLVKEIKKNSSEIYTTIEEAKVNAAKPKPQPIYTPAATAVRVMKEQDFIMELIVILDLFSLNPDISADFEKELYGDFGKELFRLWVDKLNDILERHGVEHYSSS